MFVAKLVPMKKQNDNKYRGDGFIIDQLLMAVDIPSIQAIPKDRMPDKSKYSLHRIANRMSYQNRAAVCSVTALIGSTSAEPIEAL